MKQVVAEINDLLTGDKLANQIVHLWQNANNNRRPWLTEKQELRNYIFATDTSKTANSTLPWKNKTTVPKLCQIRDNLHANYMSALFPNDNWLKWEAHTIESSYKDRRKAIEAYMGNKTREGGLRREISKLLYDYIDYGNAFYDTVWVNDSTMDAETGEPIPGYIGPRLVRLSPMDIVFNPIASSFDESWKVTRSLKTLGELHLELTNRPELGYNESIIEDAQKLRRALSSYSLEDMSKSQAFMVDGFGSLQDYFQSSYIEILEFEGSIHSEQTGEFLKNVIITIVDRLRVVRMQNLPSWLGKSTKGHASWRDRPDNVYGMGPLDNLVGMQYRIDHLENIKADAMDLAIHPPLVITGNVEEFAYGPGAEIYLGEGGAVVELGKNLGSAMAVNSEISMIEQKMEEMAGAPKQAMGIRTPGEKTAYEVQTLEMAASRIFQNKIANFEIMLLEPALNRMLEMARRNMEGSDIIRVMDDDQGVTEFLTLTKEDITASGKLRPVGARHFAAQATMVQNLMGLVGSGLWNDPGVRSHFSGKAIGKMVEELLGLEKFELYQENIAVLEAFETAQIQSQAQEELAVTDMTGPEPAEIPEEDM